MVNKKNSDLLPYSEIINLATQAGVEFGKGYPYNRLRYYTKIGLLPHAKRHSFGGLPEGAYPVWVVDKLAEIDKKLKTGRTVQSIVREEKEAEIAPPANLEPVVLTNFRNKGDTDRRAILNNSKKPAVSENQNPPEHNYPEVVVQDKSSNILPALAVATLLLLIIFSSYFTAYRLPYTHSALKSFNTSLTNFINSSRDGKFIPASPNQAFITVGEVLARTTAPFLKINVETQIAKLLNATGGIDTAGADVDLGTGDLTAANVLYGITGGDNVTVGTGQTPTLSVAVPDAGVGSVTGTSGRITSSGGDNPVLDISSTYPGQTSITTLGTVGTGVWNGTSVADPFVDNNITASNYLPLSGGALTGSLTLNDNDGASADVNLILGDINESGDIVFNNSGFTGTLTSGVLGASRVWTLPDETGTICTNTGGCGAAGALFNVDADAGGPQAVNAADTLTFVGGDGVSTTTAAGPNVTVGMDVNVADFEFVAGTLNIIAGAIEDGEVDDDITIDATGSVSWAALNTFPGACAAGSAVTAVGAALTCDTDFVESNVAETITAGWIFNTAATTFDSTATVNGTLEANGIFTLGDGGDTGSINTNDWAIDSSGNMTNIGSITAEGAIAFTPSGTNDIIFTTDADSTLIIAGLSSGSGTTICVDGTNNILTCGVGSSSATLQSAYDNGNTITTTTARNIEFNLANTATDSDFIVDILGTGNIFEVRDGGTPFFTAANGQTITTSGTSTLDINGTLAWGGATISQSLDMNNNLIENIGATGTDFTAGGGLNIATDLGVAGHGAFGGNAIPITSRIIWIRESNSTEASFEGIAVTATSTYNGISIPDVEGITSTGQYSGADTSWQATGIRTFGFFDSTTGTPTGGTLTGLEAYYSTAGATVGSITDAHAIDIRDVSCCIGAIAPANSYGIRIRNQGNAGTTNTYGLYVADQIGSANNYGLYIQDAADYSLYLASADNDVASGITLGGGDINIYRDAADRLAFSDNISVGASSAADDDYIYFDQAGESLSWDNVGDLYSTEFDISNNLVVAGAVDATGNVVAGRTAGAFADADGYSDSGVGNNTALCIAAFNIIADCNAAPSDYAEHYATQGDLEAGDLVSIHPSDFLLAVKSGEKYDTAMFGIVSTLPNDPIGQDIPKERNPKPIALVGRVPVKVSTEGGSIKPGDRLTSSSVPGVAMKATSSGPVIGMALEAYGDQSPPISSGVGRIHDLMASGSPEAVREAAVGMNVTAEEIQAEIEKSKIPVPPLPPKGVGKILVFVNPGWYVAPLEQMSNGGSQVASVLDTLTVNTIFLGDLPISLDQLGNIRVDGNLIVAGDVKIDGKILIGESSGKSVLPKGESKIFVESGSVSESSQIFVTPNTLTDKPLTVTNKTPGGFTVEIISPVSNGISFDWFVIN